VSGRHCLILRPEGQGAATTERIAALGWQPVLIPSRKIVFTDVDWPHRERQAILATSGNALRAIASRQDLRSIRVICVGDATATLARALGWRDVISVSGQVSDLTAFVMANLDPTNGPLLYPRATMVAGALEETLTAAGFELAAPPVYRADPVEGFASQLFAVINSGSGVVLLHAPSAGRDLAEALAGIRLLDWTALCLSKAVAATVEAVSWASVLTAKQPNEDSLLSLLSGHQP
jgi:uroporphyrinogen-III synthase